MTRRWIIAPIAALATLAGYLGLQLGQPLTETEIITKYAVIYVADHGKGAQLTDCHATPNMRTDVRLVVRCAHPSGTIHDYFAGPRGEPRLPDNPTEPHA